MRGEAALGAAVCLLVATSMAAPVPPYAYSQLMDMYLIQLQYQQQETALAAKQHAANRDIPSLVTTFAAYAAINRDIALATEKNWEALWGGID